MVLTAGTFVVVIASFALDVRGGAQHPWTDRVQACATWGYFFATPLLGLLAWLTRSRSDERGVLAHWPVALWLLAAISATFVHF
jgi:hypothetical protein